MTEPALWANPSWTANADLESLGLIAQDEDKHREIDDTSLTSTALWSAAKITAAIAAGGGSGGGGGTVNLVADIPARDLITGQSEGDLAVLTTPPSTYVWSGSLPWVEISANAPIVVSSVADNTALNGITGQNTGDIAIVASPSATFVWSGAWLTIGGGAGTITVQEVANDGARDTNASKGDIAIVASPPNVFVWTGAAWAQTIPDIGGSLGLAQLNAGGKIPLTLVENGFFIYCGIWDPTSAAVGGTIDAGLSAGVSSITGSGTWSTDLSLGQTFTIVGEGDLTVYTVEAPLTATGMNISPVLFASTTIANTLVREAGGFPLLEDGTGVTGCVYVASAGGTQDFGSGPLLFANKDWVIYNGTDWQRIVSTDSVVSVNEATGAIVISLAAADTGGGFFQLNAAPNGTQLKVKSIAVPFASTGLTITDSPTLLTMSINEGFGASQIPVIGSVDLSANRVVQTDGVGKFSTPALTASAAVITNGSGGLTTEDRKTFGTGTANIPEIGGTLGDTLNLVTNGSGQLITEAKTSASNVGGGSGTFKGANGTDLEFRTLTSTNASVIIAPTTDTVDLSLNTTGLDLNPAIGFAAALTSSLTSTATSALSAVVRGRYVFASSDANLVGFDYGNPSAPVTLGSFPSLIQTGSKLVIYGAYILAYQGLAGDVRVIDTTTPKIPRLVLTITGGNPGFPPLNDVGGIVGVGRYLYVAFTGGGSNSIMRTYEFSGDAAVQIGVDISMTFTTSARCDSLVRDGNYLYAGGLDSREIRQIDITDAKAPTPGILITTPAASGEVDRLVSQEGILYVATKTDVLRYNIQDPLNIGTPVTALTKHDEASLVDGMSLTGQSLFLFDDGFGSPAPPGADGAGTLYMYDAAGDTKQLQGLFSADAGSGTITASSGNLADIRDGMYVGLIVVIEGEEFTVESFLPTMFTVSVGLNLPLLTNVAIELKFNHMRQIQRHTTTSGERTRAGFLLGNYFGVFQFTSGTVELHAINGTALDYVETSAIESGVLTTRANASIGNDLNVAGTATIGAGMFVGGDSVFAGDLAIGETHTIRGCIETPCLQSTGNIRAIALASVVNVPLSGTTQDAILQPAGAIILTLADGDLTNEVRVGDRIAPTLSPTSESRVTEIQSATRLLVSHISATVAVGDTWFRVRDEPFEILSSVINPILRVSAAGVTTISNLSVGTGLTSTDVGLGNVQNTDLTGAVGTNTNHRGLTDNPHSVTKAQVGLGLVLNSDLSTLVTANTNHAGTFSNPHGVTKTQVGLSAVLNSDLTPAVVNNTTHRGSIGNPHLVSKAQVGLSAVVNSDLTPDVGFNTNHRGLFDNPHGVTKTQVGLSAVQNTDLSGAVSNNTDHSNDTNNPHGVDKDDVGLGVVPNTNFTSAVASNTGHRTTTTGNPHNVDKTDLSLDNVVNVDFTAPVSSNTTHREIISANPHGVSKADVGLGSVQNVDYGAVLAPLANPDFTGRVDIRSEEIDVWTNIAGITFNVSPGSNLAAGNAELSFALFIGDVVRLAGGGGSTTYRVSAIADAPLEVATLNKAWADGLDTAASLDVLQHAVFDVRRTKAFGTTTLADRVMMRAVYSAANGVAAVQIPELETAIIRHVDGNDDLKIELQPFQNNIQFTGSTGTSGSAQVNGSTHVLGSTQIDNNLEVGNTLVIDSSQSAFYNTTPFQWVTVGSSPVVNSFGPPGSGNGWDDFKVGDIVRHSGGDGTQYRIKEVNSDDQFTLTSNWTSATGLIPIEYAIDHVVQVLDNRVAGIDRDQVFAVTLDRTTVNNVLEVKTIQGLSGPQVSIVLDPNAAADSAITLNGNTIIPDGSSLNALINTSTRGTTPDTSDLWHDIIGSITVVDEKKAQGPGFKAFMGNIWAYEFDTKEETMVFITYHIPHDYKLGSDIFFHAHVASKNNPPDTGNIRFGFEFTSSKGHSQEAFQSEVTVYAEQAGVATQYMHQIIESAGVTITGLEPDSLIICRVFRDIDGSDTNTDKIFLLTADVHYQSSKFGTINKEPNFYV